MAGIKHIFQSAIPDGMDASLVNPSNWNAVHDIPATGIQVGDAVTNDMTAVAASGKLQLLQRNILDTDYEFVTQKSVKCTLYDFTRNASQTITTAGTYSFDFVTIPPGLSAYVFAPSYNVVNATNNGSGLVRLTFSSVPGQNAPTWETGMLVVSSGVGGVSAANGTFIVTKIGDYIFDLQGTTFSGTYTSGGTAQQRPHYLYLSAGTGTAEACPIVSISGTTVSLYVALPKGGSYTISSATAGIQEAVYSGESKIWVPGGFNNVGGTCTIDGTFTPGVQIFGGTASGNVLMRRPTFTRGDVIRCINNSGTSISNLSVYNVNAVNIVEGAAFSFRNGNTHVTYLNNITVLDERVGLYIAGCNSISAVSFHYFQTPTITAVGDVCYAGLWLATNPWSSNGNLQFANCVFQGVVAETGGFNYTNQLRFGIRVEQCDGVHIVNTHFKAITGILLARTDLTKALNYINFTNIETDGCRDFHLNIYADDYSFGDSLPGGGTAGVFQNISFCNLSAQAQLTDNAVLFIGGLGVGESGIKFTGCLFSSSYRDNIVLQQTRNVSFVNCPIMNANQNNSAGRYAIGLTGSLVENISFVGCRIDYLVDFTDFSYGIKLAAIQMNNIIFNGLTLNRSISHGITLFSGCTLRNSTLNNNMFNGLAKFVSETPVIPDAISNAAAAVFNLTDHGLTSGDTIEVVGGTVAWLPINGIRVITVIDDDNFSIPVDSTSFGAVSGTISYRVYLRTISGFGISLGGVVDGVTINGNTFFGCGFGSIDTSSATVTGLSLGDNNYQETTQGSIASATTISLPVSNFLPLIPVSGTTSIATINGGWNRRRVTIRTTGILSLTAAGNIARAFGPTVAGQTIDLIYDSSTAKWYPN